MPPRHGNRSKPAANGAAVLFCVILAGCAQPHSDYDPLEPVNRQIFAFNHLLDRRAAVPAATFYRSAVPSGVREGLHNFLSNFGLPITFANDVLQGEMTHAGFAACRLGVNLTVGVLGFRDPATDMGCLDYDEDFGQTLGVYGMPAGPYLVLPFVGASLPRDILGKGLVDHYFNPLGYVTYRGRYYVSLSTSLVRTVDQRSRSINVLEDVERTSVDYYATSRNIYLQKRDSAIQNTTLSPDSLAPDPPTK